MVVQKQERKELLKCEYCDFHACLKCSKRYILTTNIPGCMNPKCTGEWSRKFIRTSFSLHFINTDLRDHKKQILFAFLVGVVAFVPYFFEKSLVL